MFLLFLQRSHNLQLYQKVELILLIVLFCET